MTDYGALRDRRDSSNKPRSPLLDWRPTNYARYTAQTGNDRCRSGRSELPDGLKLSVYLGQPMGITRTMLLALLTLVAAWPTMGQWQRVITSGKGTWTDVPAPHPLSYFIANPILPDDAGELCAGCPDTEGVVPARKLKVQSTIKTLGVLAGYRIVQVLYSIRPKDEEATPDSPKWKSILVQVGKDSFREIFHLQNFYSQITLESSRIVQSGTERVLVSMDPDGGNGGSCWEGYWWFDRSGPHAVDFSPLYSAMRERAPANTTFLTSCSVLDFEKQEVNTAVQKSDAQCHACDYVGIIKARFRLDGATARPVEVRFQAGDPDSVPEDPK